ncbi:hypothetical protein SK128_011958 [Halocaridina rubra]|uniref:Uncharacterized protein n=1 Tax=Halocaridina rubra TaxID=373956 RepID=A0AAN8WS55_HALRR
MGVEVEKEEKANNGQQTEGCEEKLVGPADDSVDSQAPTTAQLTVTSTSSPYNTTTTTVIKPRRFHIRRKFEELGHVTRKQEEEEEKKKKNMEVQD